LIMKDRLSALLWYSVYWMAFFMLSRLFFILFQYHVAFAHSAGELLSTFIHGSRLDLSTLGYFLVIPVLLTLVSVWLAGDLTGKVMKFYTYFLIVFSSLIVVGDATLYTYWGFRMDYTPLFYLKTPGEAAASVSTLDIVIFVLEIVAMCSFWIYLYSRLINLKFRDQEQMAKKIPWTAFVMLLLGSLIIPVRGGFSIAPINAGSVYFSKKMFLNHASINAIWNVGTSAFTQKPVKNPYSYGNPSRAAAIVDSMAVKTDPEYKVVIGNHPNVMFIILESFSGYLIGGLGGDSLVTPNFNRYSKQGILFTNFYASGTRTDKAIPAILSGYPALPALSVIKEPKKSQSLPNIVRMLIDNGYYGSFWYGGEINFANFNSYVIGSGFSQIITKENFPSESYNSKWGVHDHIMFKALSDSMKKLKEPFVSVVLTLSSHEPFDVPMEPVFKGDNRLVKYKNSVYYADKALGDFLDGAAKSDWWKNTVIILVADHCCRVFSEPPMHSKEAFRIPMLWLGGRVLPQHLTIDRIGCQSDIPVTLASQLGLAKNFPFGKDLFSEKSIPFAFYTFNEGFGFIDSNSASAWDQKLKKPVMMEGKDPETALKTGKAFLQHLFDDYLKR